MIAPFSVLISVYYKESPAHLQEALDSIVEQTIKPAQIVLVEDGPLTQELDNLLAEYVEKCPELELVQLGQNRGLGLALAEGLLHCKYELVARMDSDDIAREDRFEIQLNVFKNNPAIDICGSHMLEFEGDVTNIVTRRRVPLTDTEIKHYQKWRDGFNHVTVMFKKSSVLSAGNYQHCPLMEDTLLWVNMFNNGATAMNIDDYLVNVRIGKDMYERRGGWEYYKKYKQARKQIYDTGYISWFDYQFTLLIQMVVALIPNKIRGFVFKKLLHC